MAEVNVGSIVNRVSKKLGVAGTFLVWLTQAPVPDDIKVKYGSGLTLAYLVVQGIIDAIKSWKGRNPTTASNEQQAQVPR